MSSDERRVTPVIPSGIDLAVDLGGLAMKNPVTDASGTFGCGEEYGDFIDLDALGALTAKGVSPVPWPGNAAPRMCETPSGMLNCIGLQNPGVEFFCAHKLPWLTAYEVPLIVNVVGHALSDYTAVIGRLERESRVDAYEVNISCPNVDAGGMALGTDPALAAEVTRACRACTSRPLIVKLTPNVTDIADIARAVESAGADVISLINTVRGMAVDAHCRRPKLSRPVAGLSGPAIKPIALAFVWQVAQAVDIPILGMGGIVTGEDAVEFLLAGATSVSVGTANFMNPYATIDVISGIAAFCATEGVHDVNDLIGGLQC
jgi:dihydroorotate dehydrogenase (NAD+) catalytic subunit